MPYLPLIYVFLEKTRIHHVGHNRIGKKKKNKSETLRIIKNEKNINKIEKNDYLPFILSPPPEPN